MKIEELIDDLIDAAYNSGYYSRGPGYADLCKQAIKARTLAKYKLLEEIEKAAADLFHEYHG